MKNTLSLYAVYCAILLNAFIFKAQAQDIHSQWTNTPVNIDGIPSEWPEPFRYYDGDTKLQFAVANDTANLYLCLKVTDEPTQMRIFRGGLNIWIDPKGKKKETTGVTFPMSASMSSSDMPRSMQQSEAGAPIPGQTYQKHDFNTVKAKIIAHQQTVKLTGFFGVPDQIAPLQNHYGINVAFGWDSLNILTIEYRIPIALVQFHHLMPGDTLHKFGLGFIEPPVEGGEGHHGGGEEGGGGNGGGGGYGGRGGGMGGMGGGGMGGGGMGRGGGMGGGMGGGGHGGGMGGGSNPNSQEEKLWAKMYLSYQS